MSGKTHRTDYDAIASRYDLGPFRAKQPDPELEDLVASRGDAIRVLDIACGTGNQLVANRSVAPRATFVGLDYSMGMLRIARAKSREIHLVHASGVALPFADASFDFISHQFAFHHIPDKPALLREARRVLAPGGRFVLANIDPHTMAEAALFRYFPEALANDRRDFPEAKLISAMFRHAGFADVVWEDKSGRAEVPLSTPAKEFRDKSSSSELTSLTDAEYARGLARLEADIAAKGADALVPTEWTVTRVRGT